MANRIIYAQGSDGQVELLGDRLVIHRKGIFNMLKHGMNAKREIPLSSIASVNFREATFFRVGEISFDHAGRSQLDDTQNTVKFTRKLQPQFLLLKEKVFEMMQQGRK